MNNIIKNFRYVFSAQILILFLGILRSVLIPVFLTVQNFGYWQIYIFYISYVGIFSLGVNDGIYIRYGKYQYEELPYKKIRSSNRIHLLVSIFSTILCLLISVFFVSEKERFIYVFVSLNIFVLGLNGILVYIFQITNQMKKYSIYSIFPKFIFIILVLIFFILKINNFKFLVISDLLCSSITVVIMIFNTKEIWIGSSFSIKNSIVEYNKNVKIGIQLMLAQLMGLILIGLGRFLVQMIANIEDFAYYSFGITLTNLILVLISSVSVVMYPTLNRVDRNSYSVIYKKINNFLSCFFVLIPIAYFMAVLFIQEIVPKYIPVLSYLNILFAIIMLQVKMQVLNNNFYKVLRKENAMMKANFNTLLLFLILSIPIYYTFKSIIIIPLITFISTLFRCYSSETYITNILNIKNNSRIIIELFFILLFIFVTSFFSKISIIVYFIFIIFLVLHKREKIILYLSKSKEGI